MKCACSQQKIAHSTKETEKWFKRDEKWNPQETANQIRKSVKVNGDWEKSKWTISLGGRKYLKGKVSRSFVHIQESQRTFLNGNWGKSENNPMRKRFNEKNLVELHQFQIKANKYAHGASNGEKNMYTNLFSVRFKVEEGSFS